MNGDSSVSCIDQGSKVDREKPVAHVIRLPQLSRDEELSDGIGLLREDNIAQVHIKKSISCFFFLLKMTM